jgi:uncharacterized protein YgiM (DUF1202 family)
LANARDSRLYCNQTNMMATMLHSLPISLVIIGFLGGLSTQSFGRGLQVELLSSEMTDRPVEKSVQLYSASYALVIGNDAYKYWPRLTNAVKDARLVSQELEAHGFEVTLKMNLSSSQLEDSLETFYIEKGANQNARLLVWFAGHGATVDGNGYLVPVDSPVSSEVTAFKRKALSLRRFDEYVREARSKHALGIFDACFAGTIFESQRDQPSPAITLATTKAVRQFLTSGDEGEKVRDDGTFRKLFIRALRGEEPADANSDGYLTASELGFFLHNRMVNLKQGQTPRYGKLRDEDYDRGDFVFAVLNAKREKSISVMDQTMYVSGDGKLNVRIGPDPSSSKLAELDRDTSLIVTGDVVGKDWYRVRLANGLVGFAWSKRLSYEKIQIEEIDWEMYVAGDGALNLRSGPNTRYSVIKKLEPGASLDVTGKVAGKEWYRIGLDNGKIAFAWSKRLSYEKIQIEEMDGRMYVSGKEKLKVRSGPSTRYDIIKILHPSMSVDITGKIIGKDWFRINIGERLQGFVWSKRISEK